MNAVVTAFAARRTVRATYADADKFSGVKDAAGTVVAYTFTTGGRFGFLIASGTIGRLSWDRRDAARRAQDAAAGHAELTFRLPACDSTTELIPFLADNPFRDLAELLPACADDCHGVAFRSDYKGTCSLQAALYRVYSAGTNAADYLKRADRDEQRGKTIWAANLRKSVQRDREQMERVVRIWAAERVCEHTPVTPFGA